MTFLQTNRLYDAQFFLSILFETQTDSRFDFKKEIDFLNAKLGKFMDVYDSLLSKEDGFKQAEDLAEEQGGHSELYNSYIKRRQTDRASLILEKTNLEKVAHNIPLGSSLDELHIYLTSQLVRLDREERMLKVRQACSDKVFLSLAEEEYFPVLNQNFDVDDKTTCAHCFAQLGCRFKFLPEEE